MNQNDNQTHKLTDEQFVAIYTENGGLPSKTAKAIEAKYKIKFSRQAVRERAKKFPDIVFECRDELVEMAEDNLRHLLNCDDLEVKRKTTIYVLNTLGRASGYGKTTVTHEPAKPEEYFEIDGKKFIF